MIGGATIYKKFFVGDTSDASSSTMGGSVTISGGAAIAKKLFVGDSAYISSTRDASSTSIVFSLLS